LAKRKIQLTEKKIKEMEKRCRGQGEGIEYTPWITIQDFPSNGLVTRGKGWKTKRVHHFLSKLERDYFYFLEWCSPVIDIREQFPLNREDTLWIANKMNIKHPVDSSTQVPIVMTTDFMITIKNPKGITHVARTIKPSQELENKRTIEKFEIERAYWRKKQVNWGIVTEKDMPKNLIANVEWLHSAYFGFNELSNTALDNYIYQMRHLIGKYKNFPIIDLVTDFDERYSLENGMGLELLKYLIAHKEIHLIDIHKKLFTNLLVKDVFTVV
jgi:hypothetical protein